MTYTVTITLSMAEPIESLQDDDEIRNEVRSWLEDLGATVHQVDVQEER